MSKKQKQYVVVGLGRFGRAIAETLCQDGAEVLGVDQRMDLVERMRDELTQTIQMDAMDRDALETLGIRDFDIVFVTMGSDIRASGTIVLLLKELGARRVIAKAHDEFHGRMLEKLGADQVLFPERDMGRRVAHSLISGNVIEFMELSTQYSMAEIRPKPEWIGRTLKELAGFVSGKLSPLETVTGTATSFVLKRYKEEGVIFDSGETDRRLVISP